MMNNFNKIEAAITSRLLFPLRRLILFNLSYIIVIVQQSWVLTDNSSRFMHTNVIVIIFQKMLFKLFLIVLSTAHLFFRWLSF